MWLSSSSPSIWVSLVTEMVKNPPAMRETWVRSLGREDSPEEGMATHSSILAWRIPWTEEPGGLQSMGWKRVGHDWATKHSTVVSCHLVICELIRQVPALPSPQQMTRGEASAGWSPTWISLQEGKDEDTHSSPCSAAMMRCHQADTRRPPIHSVSSASNWIQRTLLEIILKTYLFLKGVLFYC